MAINIGAKLTSCYIILTSKYGIMMTMTFQNNQFVVNGIDSLENQRF